MDVKHSKLLPCPFCGCNDIGLLMVNDEKEANYGRYFAACDSCGCRTDLWKSSYKDNAIEHWNQRANSYYPDKALIAELVEALEWAQDDLYIDYPSSSREGYYKKRAESLDYVIEKAHQRLKGTDLTHRSTIDDVKGANHAKS